MALRPEHEIHHRRFSRNLGVGLTLGVFILLVFLLTIVKVQQIGHSGMADPQAQTGQAQTGQAQGQTQGTAP